MLDYMYNGKHVEYELDDGQTFTSNETPWRDLPWNRVVKITVVIRQKRYVFERGTSEGFLNVRYGGRDKEWFERDGELAWRWKQIHTWVIGLIKDGMVELTEIDFKTGDILRKAVEPVSTFKKHIHPDLGIAV